MKKRSSYIIIVVLVILVGASTYLYFSKSKLSTVDQDSRKFAFKDTAAITRIFIADKDNHQSTIERTPKGWVVNGKYNCRTDAVLNLMEVIKHVDVKLSVPKASRENVIKYMSFNAIKVEIYAGDEKVRQYYVGHETPDAEGSYMLLTDVESGDNFKDPYVCWIPGFNGFLQPRFIASENDWRDRIVINFIPPQLISIKVEHTSTPADSSFVITLKDANTFKIKDLKGAEVNFEEEKLRQYLVYYQNISYEKLITGKNIQLQDSLSHLRPFSVITVNEKNGKTHVYKCYRKSFPPDTGKEHGVVYEYDPDRFYMSFDNGAEWAQCQYYVFGKLLANASYFQPSAPVKK
jgi:hypothetical protein